MSKSKVTEISDNSKQVDETWTRNTSAPPSNLSQVNTIGCADEGLDILAGRQQETSAHGELGRSVLQQD